VALLSTMIFTPIVLAPVVYLVGRRSGNAASLLALTASLIVFLLSLGVYGTLYTRPGGGFAFVEGPYPWVPQVRTIDYYLGLDGLSAPLVLLSTFITVLVVLGSRDLIHEMQGAYYGLLLLFEGAIIGVFTSLNLILFYIFWEVVLIPMFFFIGVWGGPNRRYAAMKFLLFTFVGGVVMLFGFLTLFFFGPVASFNIPDLLQAGALGLVPRWLQVVGSIALFAGFGVKLPSVPLHTWLPDAHVEAPSPISVLLAGVLLKMGGYGFLRLSLGLFPQVAREFAWVYILLGVVTMFYGALVAMVQDDLKRMIALTSINHMGFVLVGGFAGNTLGLQGAVFQMFNHGAAIGILFMLSGYVHHQTGTRSIPELKGLKVATPRTAALLTLGSIAGMGVPPFSTFLSELMVIFGAIGYSYSLAVLVLVPALTVGYFLWMLKRVVFSPPVMEGVQDMPRHSFMSLTLYLVPLLILLVFPGLIVGVVEPVVPRLLGVG
jgi:NADH-quinone oxidoreductase subunit M